MEEAVDMISQVNANTHFCTAWDTQEAEEAEEVGVLFDMILNIKNDGDGVSAPDSVKVAEVNQDCEVGCTATKNLRRLGKSATFSSAGGHFSTALDGENSITSGNVSYTRALSLPSSLKLVSALKGGREQQGLPPKEKTNVKWAADVYEPPTTSMSHTVRSSRQYYRSTRRKDNHKHKHKKGSKSSRGGNNEKKRFNSHKGVSGSDNLRQRVLTSPALLPLAEVEFPVSGNQESKCGSSSFLMPSLTQVHYSVAEA